jgi:hypothetical protein
VQAARADVLHAGVDVGGDALAAWVPESYSEEADRKVLRDVFELPNVHVGREGEISRIRAWARTGHAEGVGSGGNEGRLA